VRWTKPFWRACCSCAWTLSAARRSRRPVASRDRGP
jgi:hypothetical protein